MSRPRRGTPEGEIAHAKWKKTMLEKYGADGLHAMMKRIGAKGGRNGRSCGIIISKGDIMNIIGYEEYQILSNGVVIGKNGMPMKPQVDDKGYLRVQLRDKNKKNGVATFKVHRLVAQHFIPNPDDLPQVDHIDGDKSNNDVSNLEWVSNEENQRRAVDRGAYLNRTPKEIVKYGSNIWYAITQGYVASDLFEKYGICRKTFWRAVEDGRVAIGNELPDLDGVRKRVYYYYDKSRCKWRVERSDYIKVGKQFDTEKEARDYAESCIHAGGFASDNKLARIAGKKGGMIGKRSEAKSWFDKNETTIARMLGDGASYEEIARKLNVDSHRVYYCVKKYGAEYETI